MTIVRLPRNDARAITSTLVLNDAVSVIKELVDNAIDAKATSVSIEISANALDVISVRDNGTGIGVEDRLLLCKQGYTSKIRSFEDLESLGGTFLGFRGEALSSVVALSKHLVITSRVEGEAVGTSMKFRPDGKLLDSTSASHPVGTTVRVEDFLITVPVRKQAASKTPDKTLAAIQKLLQAYAFAKPFIRLSFKVLKAKKQNFAWQYAATSSVTQLQTVATCVLGKAIAQSCEQHSAGSGTTASDGADCIHVEALMVSGPAAFSILGNSGQFISVDGRPIASDRGLMKKATSMYKEYIHNAFPTLQDIPTKPFIYLQIQCPPGEYDVNIEPAKDELLFRDPQTILDVVRRVFVLCYGEMPAETSPEISSTTNALKRSRGQASCAFELLLANKQPSQSVGHNHVQGEKNVINTGVQPDPISISETSSADILPHSFTSHGPLIRNMYDVDPEIDTNEHQWSIKLPQIPPHEHAESAGGLWDNPFTKTALQARCPQSKSAHYLVAHSMNRHTTMAGSDNSSPIRNPVRHSLIGTPNRPSLREAVQLPTPARSVDEPEDFHPGPPVPRKQRQHAAQKRLSCHPQHRLLGELQGSSGKDEGMTPLTSKTATSSPREDHVAQDASSHGEQDDLRQIMKFEHRKRALQQSQRVKASKAASDLAFTKLGNGLRERFAVSRPLRRLEPEPISTDGEPVLSERDVDFHVTSAPGLRGSESPAACSDKAQKHIDLPIFSACLKQQSENGAGQEHAENLNFGFSSLEGRSFSSMYPLAKAGPGLRSTLEDSTAMQRRAFRKAGSSKLPLESIATGESNHNVVASPCDIFPDLDQLMRLCLKVAKTDPYIPTGSADRLIWSPANSSVSGWQTELEALVCSLYSSGAGETDVRSQASHATFSLVRAIKVHVDAYGK